MHRLSFILKYPVHVSNSEAIPHQEAILYTAFGMNHVENILKLFKLCVVKNVRIKLYKIIYIYIR